MNHFLVGENIQLKKRVFLPIEQFAETHTHIIGRSGVGKSKFLEHLACTIMEAGYGLILLDGKGELYDNLLKYCTDYFVPPKKVTLINPRDENAPGLNILECLGDTQPDTQAGLVLDAIKKIHGEEKEAKPWLDRWGRSVFCALSEAGLSILEAFDFIRSDDLKFRHAVLSQIKNSDLKKEWQAFEGTYNKPKDQAEILDVINNRCAMFRSSLYLKGMFGQKKTTINWESVMNKGEIILARLSPGNIDSKALSFIGIMMMHQINQVARTRAEGLPSYVDPPPCFVIMDEFQEFLSPDIANVLEQLRSFRIHFLLSHHNLRQLEEESPRISSAVMSCCRNKIVFTIEHRDAEIMIDEIFTKETYEEMQKVKHEEWRTFFEPVREIKEVETETEVEGRETRSPSPEEGDIIWSSSERRIASTPITEHIERQERASTTFYSEAEARAKYIDILISQPNRNFQLKIEHQPALSMQAPFIKDLDVWINDLDRFKANVYNLNAHPINKVYEEVERRPSIFLSENISKREDQETDFDEPDTSQPKRKR